MNKSDEAIDLIRDCARMYGLPSQVGTDLLLDHVDFIRDRGQYYLTEADLIHIHAQIARRASASLLDKVKKV